MVQQTPLAGIPTSAKGRNQLLRPKTVSSPLITLPENRSNLSGLSLTIKLWWGGCSCSWLDDDDFMLKSLSCTQVTQRSEVAAANANASTREYERQKRQIRDCIDREEPRETVAVATSDLQQHPWHSSCGEAVRGYSPPELSLIEVFQAVSAALAEQRGLPPAGAAFRIGVPRLAVAERHDEPA